MAETVKTICGAVAVPGTLCSFAPDHFRLSPFHSWEVPDQQMPEQVDHPAHYNSLGARCKEGHPIECIDVVQHMTFNQGNAVKYLWRLGEKGNPAEQLRKAIWYCQQEIARLEGA